MFLRYFFPENSGIINSVTQPVLGQSGGQMLFYAFYVIAAIIMVLHFTGWLKNNNLEWLILVLAVAVFPVVVFLR